MVQLVDALDDVLARVAAGESLEGCLARYPSLAAELNGLIKAREQLSVLSPAPALPADALAAHRRQFLAAVRTYKRQTTSADPLQRLVAWIWPEHRTGQSAFVPALARVVIACVLVLSILGGTVAAAQSSLPDSPLYSAKLVVEDARLKLAHDPAQQATLAMAFAGERTREMEQLAIAHRPVSNGVSLRLHSQLETALSAAAQAPEPEMLRLLDQVRAMAQTLERALAQAQVNAPREPGTQDALRQAEQAMAQAWQQAESGLTDPNAFRNRYRHDQSAPVWSTPEATAMPQPPMPTASAQPTATLEATATPQPSHMLQVSVTPQRIQAGTGQPSTNAPGPQPTADQGGPRPQATETAEGIVRRADHEDVDREPTFFVGQII